MTKEEMRGLVGRALGGRLLTVEFKGGKKMRTTVEVVGPELAAKYLQRNDNNRPLRGATVSRYAAMMRRGQWMLTHEAIAFDTNGDLKNGQHRLAAVIESGASVQFTVTRGVDPATFEVIDSGAKRSASDRLQQVGAPYYRNASTAIRYLLLYKQARDIRWMGKVPAALVNDRDILRTYEQIGEALLTEAGAAAFRAGVPEVGIVVTSGMAVYLLLKEADPEGKTLESFWEGLVTGVDLKKADSRLALRRWSANVGNVPGKGQRTMVALIKAWNAHVKGQPLSTIKWLPSEPMPEIVSTATAAEKAAVAR